MRFSWCGAFLLCLAGAVGHPADDDDIEQKFRLECERQLLESKPWRVDSARALSERRHPPLRFVRLDPSVESFLPPEGPQDQPLRKMERDALGIVGQLRVLPRDLTFVAHVNVTGDIEILTRWQNRGVGLVHLEPEHSRLGYIPPLRALLPGLEGRQDEMIQAVHKRAALLLLRRPGKVLFGYHLYPGENGASLNVDIYQLRRCFELSLGGEPVFFENSKAPGRKNLCLYPLGRITSVPSFG